MIGRRFSEWVGYVKRSAGIPWTLILLKSYAGAALVILYRNSPKVTQLGEVSFRRRSRARLRVGPIEFSGTPSRELISR